MMKVTKCKNGGDQNAHHNGRNSQVSGGGFKKEDQKKWDKVLRKVLKH
jgi:hypothetical protein